MASPPPELSGRTDDCGNPVQVLSAAAAADWPMSGDERISMLAARMRAASTPSRWLRVVFAAIALAVVLIVIAVSRILFPSVPGWVRTVALMIVVMGMSFVAGRIRRRLASAALTKLLIEEGLCPSCGYNFFGLAEDEAGLLHCPECGAAWRADRIRRVEAFASGANMADANTIVTVAGSSWTSLDDRGMRRPIVHPRLRRELKAAPDEAIRARLEVAKGEIRRSGRVVRWVVAGMLFAAAAGMAAASFQWGRPGVGAKLAGMLPAAVFAGIGLWALLGNFCYSMTKLKRAMLGQDLCPGCGRSLEGLPAEPDGRVVCSGCLGAWQTGAAAAEFLPPLSTPPANTTVR